MSKEVCQEGGTISEPLPCERCDEEVAPKRVSESNIFACPHCGHKATETEWQWRCEAPMEWADPDNEPADNLIRKYIADDEVRWEVPAQKNMNFTIRFGLMASALVFAVTLLLVVILMKFYKNGWDAEGENFLGTVAMIFVVYGGFMWIFMFGVLGYGLAQSFSKHVLIISEGHLVYLRSLFMVKTKRLYAVSDIVDVGLTICGSQNYEPVYEVTVATTGKPIKLLSALQMDEKSWLVADIQRFLSSHQVGRGTNAEAPVRQTAQGFKVIFQPRGDSFATMLMGALLGAGGFIIWYWAHFMPGHEFRGVNVVISMLLLISLTICFAGVAFHLYHDNLKTEVVGTGSSVKVYNVRKGSKKLKYTLKREEVLEARVVRTVTGGGCYVSLYLYTDKLAVEVVRKRTEEDILRVTAELKRLLKI